MYSPQSGLNSRFISVHSPNTVPFPDALQQRMNSLHYHLFSHLFSPFTASLRYVWEGFSSSSATQPYPIHLCPRPTLPERLMRLEYSCTSFVGFYQMYSSLNFLAGLSRVTNCVMEIKTLQKTVELGRVKSRPKVGNLNHSSLCLNISLMKTNSLSNSVCPYLWLSLFFKNFRPKHI